MKRITNTSYPLIEKPKPVDAEHPVTARFMTNHYVDFQCELTFPDSSELAVWNVWREKLRTKLKQILCIESWGDVLTPEIQILEQQNCDGYLRQKIAYETFPENWAVAYLLIPKQVESPTPAVLCPHGHVNGAKLGVVEPGMGPGIAYGHEFAQRGFVVLAPDNVGMGERDVPESETSGSRGCDLLFRRLNYMGLDLTGLRVFELMVGLNILCAMEQVDSSRIGCAGLSGGCWLAMVTTALDERIKAVILSGYFTTFMQTSWHGHCLCHHPHGIGKLCEMPDIAALIAPRSQFVESGKQDYPYPVEPAFSLVRRAYELLGAEKNLGLDQYDGGHMFYGANSISWMVEQLMA